MHRKDLNKIIIAFLATRIFIIIIGAIAFNTFPQRGDIYRQRTIAEVLNIKGVWNKFDSGWHLNLTENGYPQRKFSLERQENWGFLPLYPMTIKAFSHILNWDYFWIGILISNLCSFGAVLIIYKLIKEKFSQGVETITLILISAGSFYLSVVYAEGLFVFLTALVFYLTHRGKFSFALIIAGLASVTKIQGCLLFIIPGIEILFNHRRTFYKYIPAFFISLIPIAALMLYLDKTSGEALAFIKIQAAWGSTSLYPLQGLAGLIRGDRLITSLVNSGFWIMNIGIVLSCYKKLPLSYTLFTVACFLICTSNEIVYGSMRYMLGVIPIFIAAMMSNKYIYQFFLVVNVMFLALTIAAFVTGASNFI